MHQPRSQIQRPPGTGTWHYLDIPFDTVREFGGKGQIKVRGTLNGIAFPSTLLPTGGAGHYLVVGKELRDQAAVAAGDPVEVFLELDPEPRTVELHPEFAAALQAIPQAHDAFRRLPYSHQKRYNDAVAGARQAATRAKRVQAALRRLTEGYAGAGEPPGPGPDLLPCPVRKSRAPPDGGVGRRVARWQWPCRLVGSRPGGPPVRARCRRPYPGSEMASPQLSILWTPG